MDLPLAYLIPSADLPRSTSFARTNNCQDVATITMSGRTSGRLAFSNLDGPFERSFSPSTTISTCLVRPPRQLSIPQRCRRRCWHFLLLAQPFFSSQSIPASALQQGCYFAVSTLKSPVGAIDSSSRIYRGRVSCNYFHILNQKDLGTRAAILMLASKSASFQDLLVLVLGLLGFWDLGFESRTECPK